MGKATKGTVTARSLHVKSEFPSLPNKTYKNWLKTICRSKCKFKKTTKFLEENIKISVHGFELGNDWLAMTPKV